MAKKKEWFGEWFDSPYYHILYQHRDFEEARHFIDTLGAALLFQPGHKVMDLCCGKGRHSIYLNQKGLNVVGLDLSARNIAYARKFENEHLRFCEHDMRMVFERGTFDFVLNLFTSFGYFENDDDNLLAIQAAGQALKPGGHFLLDFLNPQVVIDNLVAEEVKLIDSIEFHITREISDGFIVKNVRFQDQGTIFFFQEKVRAITEAMFKEYFYQSGLSIQQTWGDYRLAPYKAEQSERMIFLLEK